MERPIMFKQSMKWLTGVLVVAGALVLHELADVHGHPPASVRPPVPAHAAPAAPAARAPAPVGAAHTGNVSSSHLPPGHQDNASPYSGAAPHSYGSVQHPAAAGAVADRNLNTLGSVRSPAPAAPAAPASPAPAANRTNLGTVASPATTRTPYGTSYANALPAGYRTLNVGGTPYYYSGSHFYQPVYSGGSVVYAPTPPSQMTFSSDATLPSAPVPQQSPEEWAAASVGVAKTLLKESDSPDNKAVAKQILGNVARTYPQTKGGGEAQTLLTTVK